jgi:hypothetical protein
MKLFAKHEVRHIGFCCDDRADVCGRQIAGIYVECDFDDATAIVQQEEFGTVDMFCEPLETVWKGDGTVKLIWTYSLDEKSRADQPH